MIVLNLDSDQKICVTPGDVFVLNIVFKQKCVTLSCSILLNLDFDQKTCASLSNGICSHILTECKIANVLVQSLDNIYLISLTSIVY